MSFFDACVVLSFLVALAVVSKMLTALRLLESRVSLLQDQIAHSARRRTARAPPSLKSMQAELEAEDLRTDGEKTTHVVDDPELEALLSEMNSEQDRLKKAMGRDFRGASQAQRGPRSAAALRGSPVPGRKPQPLKS